MRIKTRTARSGKQADSIRDAPREPMAEGAVRKTRRAFSPGEFRHITHRREELAAQGRNDWQISKNLAGELGRSHDVIDNLIRELVCGGRLPANPNKDSSEKRDWASMKDGEVVIFAKALIEREAITFQEEIRKKDPGLFKTLYKRKLLGCLTFEPKQIKWGSMSDEMLLGMAGEYLHENGIGRKKDFREKNERLYFALWKRGLIGRLKFDTDERAWSRYSDAGLAERARKIVMQRRIGSRSALKAADSGLYEALRGRGLLVSVFASIEKPRQAEAEQKLISGLRLAADAMEEFGGERE